MTMLVNQSVRLPFEEPDGYDAEIYAPELLRAAESLVSPLGGGNERRYLSKHDDATLAAYE